MDTKKKTLPTFPHEGNDKKKFIEQMFDDISLRYDFLNHFLSLGIDIYWRKKFIRNLHIQNGDSILDVACGTGDVPVGQHEACVNLKALDKLVRRMEVSDTWICKRALQDARVSGDVWPADDSGPSKDSDNAPEGWALLVCEGEFLLAPALAG